MGQGGEDRGHQARLIGNNQARIFHSYRSAQPDFHVRFGSTLLLMRASPTNDQQVAGAQWALVPAAIAASCLLMNLRCPATRGFVEYASSGWLAPS